MLTVPVVLVNGTAEVDLPDVLGPPPPVVPEPVTDGCGGDRLVVVTQPAATARTSATLLAAQQLSAEAGRYPRSVRRPGSAVRARRRVLLSRMIEQRRADRA
ncbi:hypothetical protein GCU67_03185 [Modestobacter muralis]|uniref:Uncharacterized protein n=1 Tax=Modestobacter muralis TaxID=1608614 RepID=A0A6P0EQX1_9ACTN|nr:hypothetical protein [Modestobacter muralis]NEK93183.1 hypothetical protein [Modestobacter muralis]NEN49950.1 hypothetical protein [Modestobacter muralis]